MSSGADPDQHAVALSLQRIQAPPNVVQKLPNELLYHIIRLAAASDYKTAHACAYVSKAVCKWTARDRWRTVIITTTKQFKSLMQILLQTRHPCFPLRQFLSFPTESYDYQDEIITRPSTADFVENLFVETECTNYESLDILRNSMGIRVNKVLPRSFPEYFHNLNYFAVGPNEISAFDMSCARLPSKMLVTSDNENNLRNCLADIAFLGRRAGAHYQQTAGKLWVPSRAGSAQRLRSLHVISMSRHSELTGAPMPVDVLESLRSGSISPGSLIQRFKNHSPPDQTETKRYYSRGDGSDEIALNAHDNEYSRIPTSKRAREALSKEPGQGSTHIRYDTRKFSFRPCEITATRLRPFFQELTTTDTTNQQRSNQTTDFSHDGPRHAAPPRGAGNFSSSARSSQTHNSPLTPKNAVLGLFGCNKFQKLHLCWDPMPKTIDVSDTVDGIGGLVSSKQRNGSTTMATKASSPTETDWPVERQDIWTNTSSQNSEAQAPPPHTAKTQPNHLHKSVASQPNNANKSSEEKSAARKNPLESWLIPSAMESKQSKAFRADMVDAFRSTIGWTRQDQDMLSDTEYGSRGTDLAQRLGGEDKLDDLEEFIAKSHRNIAACSTRTPADPGYIAPPDESDEKLTLRLVPPAERLRLGGMYVPYTKEQRIQWFLDNIETDDA
ncbi:uncharacterized protein UTRI_05778_B [Ustilago trichophora]|uniref:F-box domain-containing protein n=1 Tax=Ustilago trichophora TaxID=86804 RepID=A0A5C3ETW0_9BASI|nr:uncharacterized protein UTRI_05778_B [Ustilago trichophora]